MPRSPLRPVLVGLGLLITTNGVVFFVAERVLDNGRSWEEPLTQAMFGAVALTAAGAVALDRYRLDGARLVVPNRVAAVAIVSMTAWMVASSSWSLTPELTRGRSLVYVGLAAFAWIVADLDFAAFRRALALAVGVAVVASLVTVALSDSIGTDRNDDWRGVFTNRNSLAPVAGVAIIVGVAAVLQARGRDRGRAAAAALPVLAGVAMLGSGSRTAWLAVLVSAGAAGLLVAARIGGTRVGPRAHRGAAAVAGLGAVGTIAVVLHLWSEPTFDQRRTIWSLVWDRIGERPLHGFGWFNVWSDPAFTAADPLLGRGSAHGSFLEVWLGLGLVGLVPFLVIVALAVSGAVGAAWREPSVSTWTWLALVLFLVIENLTESFVLWYSYNWVLLMAAALRCGVGRPLPHAPRTPAPNEVASV